MTVYILRGFSASGKSTYAREQVAKSGGVIVSRDSIRPLLTGNNTKTVLDNAGESLVTKLQQAQITAAVKAGADVYVDDTNLAPQFARAHAEMALSLGTTWEVVDFTLDAATCKAMNVGRADSVPAHVIDKQAKRFPQPWAPIVPREQPDKTPYVADYSLPKAILVDLDNTLCMLAPGFSPYDPAHYPHDTLNPAVAYAITHAERSDVEVIFFSGREGTESNRNATVDWLFDHGFAGMKLFMRPAGDNRNDGVVKQEMFNTYIRDNYHVLYVLDDRDRVIKSYRDRGIPVFQVNYGDF